MKLGIHDVHPTWIITQSNLMINSKETRYRRDSSVNVHNMRSCSLMAARESVLRTTPSRPWILLVTCARLYKATCLYMPYA